MTAPANEYASLHELYSVDPAEGMPPYLRQLYPQFLHYWQYLGTGTSHSYWEGPGYAYVPAEDPDCPLNLEFKFRRPVERPETPPEVRTALYRLFDKAGALLYIGISVSPEQRWVQHSDDKPWWSEVARIEFDWHATRAEALRREAEAIRAEKPRHNIHHNGRRAAVANPQ
ncbi:GIY-YIG nuclease family protein [Streptomyces sp. NPDC014748]|uniref:GIY-YIG nuclease family protein n=1 Tax=Streptomyces sp. NPDC014748 TaxID=3364905 RepID=UPI0036F94FCC